jgi:hypothetical protein
VSIFPVPLIVADPADVCCRLNLDDLRQLAGAALSAADVARRTTLRRLRDLYGHLKLQVMMQDQELVPQLQHQLMVCRVDWQWMC